MDAYERLLWLAVLAPAVSLFATLIWRRLALAWLLGALPLVAYLLLALTTGWTAPSESGDGGASMWPLVYVFFGTGGLLLAGLGVGLGALLLRLARTTASKQTEAETE